MKIAKIKIDKKKLFNKIKKQINPINYVECGYCKTIRVDARKLAQTLDSLRDYSDNADEELTEFVSELILQIVEPEPNDFKSDEEWQTWYIENDNRSYSFLTDYDSKMFGKYNEIIFFYDSKCTCFDKKMVPGLEISKK